MLSEFSVALLDVNSTFMFGEDRFGPEQDYAATYVGFGGRKLSSSEISAMIDSVVAHLQPIYLDPDRYDSFPQVADVLADLPISRDLVSSERALVERVIAAHEVGHIPDAHAEALRTLARSHRLGVVSNIWSRKDPWIQEMKRAEVLDVFESIVFSSDGTSVKPSQRLFERAMKELNVERSKCVFIGDSLRCDVAGAAAAGIATVWIDRHSGGVPVEGPRPTWVVSDLLELRTEDGF